MLDKPLDSWHLRLKEARMERRARIHYLRKMEEDLILDLQALRTELKVTENALRSIEYDIKGIEKQ